MLYLSIETAFSSNNLIPRIINRAFGEGCVKVQHMVTTVVMILSIIVGTFSSNIHTLMRSYLRNYSIAASLPWEEARHWKYISACCSNS